MRELLRKPPRSQPATGPPEDKHLELAEDALEQQKQINKILTKAVQFIRNGQLTKGGH
jgi:hypothetical protein